MYIEISQSETKVLKISANFTKLKLFWHLGSPNGYVVRHLIKIQALAKAEKLHMVLLLDRRLGHNQLQLEKQFFTHDIFLLLQGRSRAFPTFSTLMHHWGGQCQTLPILYCKHKTIGEQATHNVLPLQCQYQPDLLPQDIGILTM